MKDIHIKIDKHLTCTCVDEMVKILCLEVLSEYWILGADKPLSQNLKPKHIIKSEEYIFDYMITYIKGYQFTGIYT